MKKLAKIFLLIGTFTFATLSISSPLLHNHKIDYRDHNNCPAFILNATFVTMVFTFIVTTLIKFPKPKHTIVFEKIVLPSQYKNQSLKNRAPPF